jgi:hypothetical protein
MSPAVAYGSPNRSVIAKGEVKRPLPKFWGQQLSVEPDGLRECPLLSDEVEEFLSGMNVQFGINAFNLASHR